MTGEKLPYLPLYVYDLQTDEFYQRLTYPQRGVYLDMLMLQWINGSVPSNAKALLQQLRVSEDRDRLTIDDIKTVLAKFDTASNGRAENPRLRAIRNDLEQKHLKRSNAGRIGGTAKHSNAKAMVEQCSTIPEPEPEPEP